MKRPPFFSILHLFLCTATALAQGPHVVWLEAEQFEDTGGWSNDPQHVDIMGSPYLLATGLGKPVDDAVATATIPASGQYRLWVRCRDWLPEYSPGRFRVLLGDGIAASNFGDAKTDRWLWYDGGVFALKTGKLKVALDDQTGWWGRCDAVVLATEGFTPSNDLAELKKQRLMFGGVPAEVEPMSPCDVVVVGGGPAGLGASIAAARNGCQVALIQDRPVLGGNSSSEIQVPPMGYLGNPPDKVNVTGVTEEIYPRQGWHNFADSDKLLRIVQAEPNIALFLNTRATGVKMANEKTIASVEAMNVHSGQRTEFTAPHFIDCTGHGWIGFYAGAKYRMGEEARDEYDEVLAPIKATKRTQGNTLYKAVFREHAPPTTDAPSGVVVGFGERGKATAKGYWVHSTFLGGDYLHDDDNDKGGKSFTFAIRVDKAGDHDVYLKYKPYGNRASNVPVTVTHADGQTTIVVDQRHGNGWKKLGTFPLTKDNPGSVTISNRGTSGYVIAESICFSHVDEKDAATKPLPPEGIPFDCPPWAYQWTKAEDFEMGGHRRIKDIRRPDNYDVPSRGKGRSPRNDINGGICYAWWVEYGGMLDTIEDAENIRDELFRINIGLWNFAKNHNPATVERNKYRELVWLNYVPGVRESRRLIGDYVMRQSDYDNQTIHADTVAFSDWGPDVHHPEGFWVKGNDCIHVYQGRRTSIPYRTLYSKNIDNLFMAGRCHSATHIAHGGTRVMRPMCATGQAAGTAAAIAHRFDTSPRGVYQKHLPLLQQTLLKDGCYLIGVKNADENDLALAATVTASSETEATAAANATNGWNRIIGRRRNAWAPDKNATGPQWLQLTLAQPAEMNSVHVTFESPSEPCRVRAFVDGDWKTIATIEPNGIRRTVTSFPEVKTDKLRLLFDAPTPATAICEVRVYREE
jgi:hypothetical protein